MACKKCIRSFIFDPALVSKLCVCLLVTPWIPVCPCKGIQGGSQLSWPPLPAMIAGKKGGRNFGQVMDVETSWFFSSLSEGLYSPNPHIYLQ